MIENALLLRNRSGRVYAGFEKLSYLQPVVDRYLRADVSGQSTFSARLIGNAAAPKRQASQTGSRITDGARVVCDCSVVEP